MTDIYLIKNEYRPKNVKSPLLGLVLLLIIIVGIKVITTGYTQTSFERYLYSSILMFSGICVSSYLLYANYAHSIYLATTDTRITGKNILKIERNTLKFKEISFVRITKNIRVIFLKDKTGNKLSIIFHPEFIPFLKEILEKADNLDKIDINYKYFSKINAFSEISQIKPVLDRRLAEIKDKNENI